MEKNEYFNKNSCIQKINDLKKFYERDNSLIKIKPDKERILLKNVIEYCYREKCPIGYYNFYGECLYG